MKSRDEALDVDYNVIADAYELLRGIRDDIRYRVLTDADAHRAQNDGIVTAYCDVASNALFDALNIITNYGGQPAALAAVQARRVAADAG